MRYDLDQLRDLTSGVQEGLVTSINRVQQQERDFMVSRQTLGRPGLAHSYGNDMRGETLNNRAVQGGSTIVTQYNRDNLDDYAGVGANDEIDDLRRE